MKLKFGTTALVSLVTGLITTLANEKADHIVDAQRANDRASEKDNELYKLRSELREMTYSRNNLKEDADYANRRLEDYRNSNDELRITINSMRSELSALRQAAGVTGGLPAGFSQVEFDRVCEVMKTNKINAIKIVREITGLGLKEAKDLVEDGKTFVKATNAINPPAQDPFAGNRFPAVGGNHGCGPTS